jgi:hypothetical protein
MAKKTEEQMLQEMEEQMQQQEAARLAEINKPLYGEHVEKMGGSAVIKLDGVIVSLLLPVTYPQIVDALVTKKYPQDQMQAIINNHLADPEDEGHLAEFQQMQAWRTLAKATAKEILGIE